ncbi:hypothetical protein RHSIM_Rhsim11G0041400 [Rhododendron simsii]|uniref:Glycosyltransferase subfamily 4-like N-terminal domain-containing protein n=1 Tax=Rhododendron simsii TaxID=118357 RepID=A0A834GBB5_RHOSS|nr:hypothetical protein RHSIM_Rhsim11G0041400 [Rhododendron simsii]
MTFSLLSKLSTTLFFIVLFTIPALLLLHAPTSPPCSTPSATGVATWSGDLRAAKFSWNRLSFAGDSPPLARLKIAVFSRKWPVGAAPGGMERHAHTLYTALARRGHMVHVFTSPLDSVGKEVKSILEGGSGDPVIHYHEGEPGSKWRYNKAWEQFEVENRDEPFDVVHSESVALPHWLARGLHNLAVTWHGIALESIYSSIYQDLIRPLSEPISPMFNHSLQGVIPKVISEIRFFNNYQHHIAISDSCGEMLRDVYQIPNERVHVIINGINDKEFGVDSRLGNEFRTRIGIPSNASLVLGVAGRLVKDKGHPLLFEAFSIVQEKHSDVYLVVAGSGPWEDRYRKLGPQVIVLGSMKPPELRAFYNGIDIFLNPTLRPQGLDLTLMEAMMSGKPLMASRFPTIKGTIMVDDEFGFMFAPNVESLVATLEVAIAEGSKRMSRRGKASEAFAASMFTARKMALAYERLFVCIKNETYCIYR